MNINRSEIPKACKCGAQLRSYHNPGITRLVCVDKCQGFKVMVLIDHKKELISDPSAIQLWPE